MAISHALLEFIPSMFLGVPEEGTVLSVLPGHHLLLEGRGKEAIRLVALGGFGAVLVTIILLPLFALVLPSLYGLLKPYIWIILVIVVIYMFIRLNRDFNSLAWSVVIFLFSGILGWVMLNSPISSGVSLLCMFTGLFGVSTLIYSLSQKSVVPPQMSEHSLNVDGNILRGIFAGGIAGSILGFLPGMGPAQGSLLAQEISGGGDSGEDKDSFLVAMSGVNVSDALFSLIAIYLIGNPRSGIAVYIDKIIEVFNYQHLIMYIFVSITAVSLSLILCLKLGDLVSEYIQKLDYNRLSWMVIIFMSIIVLIFTLMEHANLLFVLLVYITSVALGLLPHYLGVNKSNLMGVLVVPAIVIYVGIGT
jgi:putative membrane protein